MRSIAKFYLFHNSNKHKSRNNKFEEDEVKQKFSRKHRIFVWKEIFSFAWLNNRSSKLLLLILSRVFRSIFCFLFELCTFECGRLEFLAEKVWFRTFVTLRILLVCNWSTGGARNLWSIDSFLAQWRVKCFSDSNTQLFYDLCFSFFIRRHDDSFRNHVPKICLVSPFFIWP